MTLTMDELIAALGPLDDTPDRTDVLLKEVKNLPDNLAACCQALVIYAKSLDSRSKYKKAGDRYVLWPRSFVAFTPRYKRSRQITVELRGNVAEFQIIDGVIVKDARAGSYSSCVLRNPSELAAVASYLRRANDLYGRGRKRTKTAQVTKEV